MKISIPNFPIGFVCASDGKEQKNEEIFLNNKPLMSL